MSKWFRFKVRQKKEGDVLSKTRKLVSEGKNLGEVKYDINPVKKLGVLNLVQTADFALSGGIASTNVIKALTDMKAKGVETVLLKVVPQNEKTDKKKLVSFYSNLGFKKAQGNYYAIENLQITKLPNFKSIKKPVFIEKKL